VAGAIHEAAAAAGPHSSGRNSRSVAWVAPARTSRHACCRQTSHTPCTVDVMLSEPSPAPAPAPEPAPLSPARRVTDREWTQTNPQLTDTRRSLSGPTNSAEHMLGAHASAANGMALWTEARGGVGLDLGAIAEDVEEKEEGPASARPPPMMRP